MVALSIIMIDETRRRPGAPVLSSFVFLDTTRSKRPGAPVLSSFVFLDRTPLPLGAEQGHTELESGHAPTVSYGESSRTAASRWTAPSIRVARGSLSQLGRSRYSAGRREVRPQHLPSRADHALQHVLEGGQGLESSPGLIMTMDKPLYFWSSSQVFQPGASLGRDRLYLG